MRNLFQVSSKVSFSVAPRFQKASLAFSARGMFARVPGGGQRNIEQPSAKTGALSVSGERHV